MPYMLTTQRTPVKPILVTPYRSAAKETLQKLTTVVKGCNYYIYKSPANAPANYDPKPIYTHQATKYQKPFIITPYQEPNTILTKTRLLGPAKYWVGKQAATNPNHQGYQVWNPNKPKAKSLIYTLKPNQQPKMKGGKPKPSV